MTWAPREAVTDVRSVPRSSIIPAGSDAAQALCRHRR